MSSYNFKSDKLSVLKVTDADPSDNKCVIEGVGVGDATLSCVYDEPYNITVAEKKVQVVDNLISAYRIPTDKMTVNYDTGVFEIKAQHFASTGLGFGVHKEAFDFNTENHDKLYLEFHVVDGLLAAKEISQFLVNIEDPDGTVINTDTKLSFTSSDTVKKTISFKSPSNRRVSGVTLWVTLKEGDFAGCKIQMYVGFNPNPTSYGPLLRQPAIPIKTTGQTSEDGDNEMEPIVGDTVDHPSDVNDSQNTAGTNTDTTDTAKNESQDMRTDSNTSGTAQDDSKQ